MGSSPASTVQIPREEIINPDRRICDAHHHLWDLPNQRYLVPELLDDLRSGHRVTSTIFVEWRSHYRASGPESLRPVGETEFAAQSALTAPAGSGVCAAIVAHADLRLGDAVASVLVAHAEAGRGRFRGVRHVGTWDADANVRGGPEIAPPGLYRDASFRQGLAALSAQNLTFDAWVYQTQLDDLVDMAAALPSLPIVLNHCGGVLGTGPYAGNRRSLFAQWRSQMRRLAELPNVYLKLGGLGMARSGFGFHARAAGPSSKQVAAAWRPWIEAAIEDFGPARCMFESNFPVDRAACSYAVLWNAFKRITSGCSEEEKDALFHATAMRFYRIR